MDKIGAYTNTADDNDEFTEGDPGQAIAATEVDGGWLNGVQRELLEVMTQMGLTPSNADDTLVWQALQAVYGKTFAGDPNSNVAANVLRERCWDTSTSPPTLYIATVADGTPGGSTWTRFTDLLRAASTTLKGIVELATNAETQAGTDAQRAVTPAGLASALGVTGALVPLAQATAANDAAVDFTSQIDSTYDVYVVELTHVTPASDNDELRIFTSSDGGSTFDASAGNYQWASWRVKNDGTNSADSSAGNANMRLASNIGSAAGESLEGRIVLRNPSDGTKKTFVMWDLAWLDSAGDAFRIMGGGVRDTAAIVDAIRFVFNAGNIAAGDFRLYGVKKS